MSRASRMMLAALDGSGQLDTGVTASSSSVAARAPSPPSPVGLEHAWSSAAATPHVVRLMRCDIIESDLHAVGDTAACCRSYGRPTLRQAGRSHRAERR